MTDTPRVTNADVLDAVSALKREVKRLADSHNDHERRICALEPMKPQVDRLTDHVADIGAKVGIMLQRFDAQERLMSEALRVASRALTSEVTASVRGELFGLRESVAEIKQLLSERPCLVGEGCQEHKA